MLSAFLSACGAGGSRADFDLKTVPGQRVFESEKDYDSAIVSGRYRLFNNVWNKRATSGRYRQKIFINDDGGKPVVGWVWKWRDSAGVATCPEIQAGYSPWVGEAVRNSGFPFPIGSKRLVAEYDVALEASGSYNMTFEFWAVSSLPPSPKTITHEVMIWIAVEGLAAAGSEVARATIAGHPFRVNLRKNHGDASGVHSNTWTIVSLVAERPILHGPLDVGAIIDYLVQNGYLDKSLYIANLELGNEVQRGVGTTILRNFDVKLD